MKKPLDTQSQAAFSMGDPEVRPCAPQSVKAHRAALHVAVVHVKQLLRRQHGGQALSQRRAAPHRSSLCRLVDPLPQLRDAQVVLVGREVRAA